MNNHAKIQYILPGFLNYSLNETMIEIYKRHTKIIRDDSAIYSFFGSFPRAIWNGGRVDLREPEYSIKEMKKVRDYYNKNGISIAFTFTNPLIKEEHLNDKYCNDILGVFHNGKNEVLVNSKILEKYVRDNYPKYRINQSITSTKKQNYSLVDYHLGVLKKERINDFEYLNSIPMNDRCRIELLCNEMCQNNCPYTFVHYEEMANVQLGFKEMGFDGQYGMCRFGKKEGKYNKIKNLRETSNFYIGPTDIYEKYLPLGYKYFKICGREKFSTYGLYSVIYYCIKPEYQYDIITYICEKMITEYEQDMNVLLKKIGNLYKQMDYNDWKYV